MGQRKKTPEHVFLIDGFGFLFRAYYAMPPLNRADGTPVNAVLGFTNMLWSMIRDNDADHIAVCFDSGRKTFRNDIFPDYKANRDEPPEDLIPQFSLVKEAVEAFNITSVELENFEADDLIATYTRIARESGAKVTIVSSDKDLMQLVSGNDVVILDHFKSKMIGEDGVFEKFGVFPNKVIDVQALAGDSSDNVPGVPGIGIKTAALLINEYGDLETLLKKTDEIKQPKRRQSLKDNSDLAFISRDLVTLRDDAPVAQALSSLEKKEINTKTLLGFLKSQGFASVAKRITTQLENPEDATNSSDTTDKKVSYSLIQDLSSLKELVERAKLIGTICIDTETTSLNVNKASLVGISLSVEKGEGFYIPVAHRSDDILENPKQPKQLSTPKVIKEIQSLMEDKTVLKVGQNIKYDMQILAQHNIKISPITDTMVMSFVINGSLHGHGMDELSKLYLDHKPISYKEITGSGKSKITFDLVDLKTARDYAAEDADITLRLFEKFRSDLVKNRLVSVYERMERPLIPVLMRMEQNGIKIDQNFLAKLSIEFNKRIKKLEKDAHRVSGRAFNLGSPKQLGEVLFDEMGLPSGKKGKSGNRSTSADILEDLADEGYELPPIILTWRQLTKLKSTYTDALIEHLNPKTGRVHTSFSMTTAGTGRLSSSEPNLQNIPIRSEDGKKIRSAFIAEKKHKLLSADYSQIELRILAHMANVKSLKKAFSEGLDIHSLTASQVFKMQVEDIDSETRRSAKAINFGIIYGISPFGLAKQLGVPLKEAKNYIESYFKQYPGIQDYMNRTINEARAEGYVKTLFGRKCFTPGINDKNPSRRGFSERAAINAPIQGTAADIIKISMIEIENQLIKNNLKTKMLLQVHDELIFEVPIDELKDAERIIKKTMESSVEIDVPLVVETGIGNNWAEAH
tara:strand:+ start:52769 stop:55513 length:2745 start_codon:yes stop_codon:yes gene_type:complete